MDTRLTHARVVLRDRIVDGGVRIANGEIVAIEEGGAGGGDWNCEGDFLLPGIVDLHTDSLEKHFFPRPGIDWNPVSAAIANDGAVVSVGVTTVFDSLSLGSFGKQESRSSDNLSRLVEGVAIAAKAGALKADHRLHWRCELPADDLMPEVERFASHPMTGLFSLMDHTPGQRQYMNIERFLDRVWRAGGMSEADIRERLAFQHERQARNVDRHRIAVAAIARESASPLAAHDDETAAHVDAAAAVGATIAEFPVTEVAARRSREKGMAVIMGGPNLIRGGSYSGNLGAAAAVQGGLADGFASDYVPRSLIECAFRLIGAPFGWTLADAVASVTRAPALAAGLADRGEIAVGLRADLICVRIAAGLPVVRAAWVRGVRVA
jgi:alpha-D-ribose 1-methylphosphonate 5-triphosphate diphosphatase